MTFQLVERPVPAFLVAAGGLLVVRAGRGEGELGAFGNGAKIDLDERLAGIVAAQPAPAHRQPLRPCDLAIFAAAFVLAAVEHAEADPEAAADAQIGLGQQHRAAIGTPPAGNALRRGERVEDDRWPRRDPAHDGEAVHRPRFLASASLPSAYAA